MNSRCWEMKDNSLLLLVYKALHGAAPSYIKYLISYHTSQRLLRSSSQHLLATPKANLKTYGARAFAVAAPRLWNTIPLKLRTSASIDIFKKHLKTYLFKQAF